ncbi:MAG: sulfurtransferase-like selenium metabolism protein YedF [Desulfobacteraceae bacterium]|nr:sulfurtransferase-like selenium metabolism protein YedF [Desulfobacteraceae bacterium]
MEKEKVLDCRGLACPQPVLRAMDALGAMRPGERLLVVVDNEASRDNVRRFAESQLHGVQVETAGGEYHLRIVRGEAEAPGPAPELVCEAPAPRGMVVYITAATIGRGDDELGAVLMASYIDTLSYFAKEISHIVLINSGVKLAVEGSPVLANLQDLAGQGIQVLACGTCLNHFGLGDKLRVGTVSNMFAILDTLARAGKVLSP